MNVFASIVPQGLTYASLSQHHWQNNQLQQLWQPRLAQITAVFPLLFAHAIRANQYPCAIVHVAADQIWLLQKQLRQTFGLALFVLDNSTTPATRYQIVIGQPHIITFFQAAWHAQQKATIFHLLKMPYCCRHFHDNEQTIANPLLAKLHNTPTLPASNPQATITRLAPLNSALNWLGIQLLSHEPCSMQCHPSAAHVQRFLHTGKANGFIEEIAWLEEMLAWETSWQQTGNQLAIQLPPLTTTATLPYTTNEPLRFRVRAERPLTSPSP